MKIRLGRGATIAAGAVAASLFVLLCMMFYGREEFLAPEKVLERHDAVRFRIASSLVGPLGAGAYLAMGLVFAWSVVAYFRESIGAVVPRLVGLAACVPSFCALTSLASDPHEFWAGSVGIWMGDVAFRGFGPVLAWAVVGTLFLVSFALATEFGFHGQLAALRGTLSFPLVPPAEPDEPELPVAPPAPSAATAVLEPGTEVPAEPWALPQPDLGGSGADDEQEFSEAKVVDREEHLADIRSRLAAGGPVTDAERKLLDDARTQAEMGAAIDALFTPASPAPLPAPSLAPATMPETPPFLLPEPMSQEITLEGISAVPSPAAPAPVAPAPAPAPSAGTKLPTEDLGDAPAIPTGRGRYIFAGVEFLPPNEELADPHAPATPEPLRATLPAEPQPLPSVASTVEPTVAPDIAPAPAPVPEEFEDEVFAFGFEPEAAAPASPAIPEIPAVIADAVSAPVEPEAEIVEDGAWLLAAARDLGLDPVADIERDLSASVEIPARGGITAEQAAEAIVESFHDLFGEPVVEAPVPEVVDPVVASEGPGTLLPFMQDEEVVQPTVEDATPAFAPPPVPDTADPTHLPSFATAPAEAAPEPAPEEVAEPVAPEERIYEPEPMTIEPEYIPNQEPEPGEIVRAEAAAPAGIEAAPASGTDDVLARLFGEPVPREVIQDAPSPAGPVQPEPREPPANLQPLLPDVVEQVTLLTDPEVGDCVRDHGIDTGAIQIEQMIVAAPDVVEDDAPVTAPVELPAPFPGVGLPPGGLQGPGAPVEAPGVDVEEEIAEPAMDEALVDSLVAEFKAAEPEIVPEFVETEAPVPADRDDLYENAMAAVRERGRGSVIVLQRKLGIGYTRAVRLLEELVANGVLGPENASGSHPIL